MERPSRILSQYNTDFNVRNSMMILLCLIGREMLLKHNILQGKQFWNILILKWTLMGKQEGPNGFKIKLQLG